MAESTQGDERNAAASNVQPGGSPSRGPNPSPGGTEEAGGLVRFGVTDKAAASPVVFRGDLPDLFREGQGVVAQGVYRADGVFEAREVLAKHDERYMPKEVADSLKKQGVWRPNASAAPRAATSASAAP